MAPIRIRIAYRKTDDRSKLAAAVTEGVFVVPAPTTDALIEDRAEKTQAAGSRPLWEGYRTVYGEKDRRGAGEYARTSDNVRTGRRAGSFYCWLVKQVRPQVVVEIGTAFGVSGMYWLSGLEENQRGELFTFDPNDQWRELAVENLRSIGSRYTATLGTFEDTFEDVLPKGASVDLAFIDAIHTSAFVDSQFALLKSRAQAGSVIVFDDIRFSKDMYACWSRIALGDACLASFEVGRRVGVVELA